MPNSRPEATPLPPPPPPVPFGASPARSIAKAVGFPWPWAPGLDNVWFRQDYNAADAWGEFFKKQNIIRVTPNRRDLSAAYATANHELTHPVQKALQYNNLLLGSHLGPTYAKPLHYTTPQTILERIFTPYVRDPYEPYGRLRGDEKMAGVPEHMRYEDPLPYWMGRYATGQSVPPQVKQAIEGSIYFNPKTVKLPQAIQRQRRNNR